MSRPFARVHAPFSVSSVISTRVRCPGPRVSMRNGRNRPGGTRESPECEVQLFGGTVLTRRDHFPTVRVPEGCPDAQVTWC